ncbi:MAG: hypothetical protein HY766_14730 [candidate division NC10 bacterium]|nr:hypothetical protein [candidate division NC10 bacterium]MBI4839806.1 hypothetical protein [candidate division NC10 bacterium]
MARRSRILASLEGKLGAVIRREVSKVLRRLKGQIGRRERELTALKAEFAKGMDLLRKRLTTGAAAARRRPRRRARQINWKKVFGSLPARFTLKTLAGHPVAGTRPKPHLYAVLSRWKKEGVLAKDSAGGYRKVGAKPPRKRKARRARPARVQKPAARPETPGA